MAAHWRQLQQEGILTYESHYQGQDGHLFPVEITANYLEFNGQTYNFAFIRDITECKRAEKAHIQLSAIQRELTLAQTIQLQTQIGLF